MPCRVCAVWARPWPPAWVAAAWPEWAPIALAPLAKKAFLIRRLVPTQRRSVSIVIVFGLLRGGVGRGLEGWVLKVRVMDSFGWDEMRYALRTDAEGCRSSSLFDLTCLYVSGSHVPNLHIVIC